MENKEPQQKKVKSAASRAASGRCSDQICPDEHMVELGLSATQLDYK